MGIEYFVLIGLILLVVLYDLISKGKIFKKQKGNNDITIYSKKGKESSNVSNYILVFIVLALITFFSYVVFATTLSLDKKQVEVNIFPLCTYYEGSLNNCNSFSASFKDVYVDQAANQLLGLSYVNRKGKIGTLKPDKDIIYFNQSFVHKNRSENKFETKIIVFNNNPISLFLYKNFGEGFWTERLNLTYKFENLTELPTIKNVTITKNSRRKRIPFNNSNEYDQNQFNFNVGNTFENTDYVIPLTVNADNVVFEILLNEISYDQNYSIEFYSEDDASFTEELNNIIENQPRSKTKVKYQSNNSIRLQRIIDLTNNDFEYDLNVDFFLSIFKNGKLHLKKLGTFRIDTKGPSIFTNSYYLANNSLNERVFIDEKEWRGNRHPYEITIDGYVSKLLINGINIKIDRNKNYQKLFREVYFSVPLGYYRIPIVAYDRYGNRSETYLDGTAIIPD